MNTHLDNINNQYLRYANCWEDADVLLEGVNDIEGKKVLSIASAGDNSFSLLTKSPTMVVAVDVNQVQLYLVTLKKAAFKTLEYHEFLEFLGFRESWDRELLFEKVASALSAKELQYWQSQMPMIQKGIIHTGKLERYFRLFRKWILPFIHNRRTIDELFLPKSSEAQKQFYDRVWNTRKWQFLFRFFFSRKVMGRMGRDKKFMNEVRGNVADKILKQAGEGIQSAKSQSNYFLDYILRGSFGLQLPHYAREENFEIIRKNIDRLVLDLGYVQDASSKYGKFDVYNLSNIFEYMSEGIFEEVGGALLDSATLHGRFVYWNLMVHRRMDEHFENQVEPLSKEEVVLNQRDKGFFYKGLVINQARI